MSQAWNPLQDLLVLQDRMNRLFEDATQRRAREESERRDELERPDFTPPADIYEHEAAYIISMDLPGIDRSVLEIDLDDNRLSIKGNRSIEQESQQRSERAHGRFGRTFTVPASVDEAGITAEYKDGVLNVTLPKRKEPKAKRVEIKVK